MWLLRMIDYTYNTECVCPTQSLPSQKAQCVYRSCLFRQNVCSQRSCVYILWLYIYRLIVDIENNFGLLEAMCFSATLSLRLPLGWATLILLPCGLHTRLLGSIQSPEFLRRNKYFIWDNPMVMRHWLTGKNPMIRCPPFYVHTHFRPGTAVVV
jgi:hypothetical protein